jgi:hydrogenase expression/formation protein HypC
MCLTIPARVISVRDSVAFVDVGGQRRVASTLGVPSVAPGDWAIMSAGVLIRVLDRTTASELADAFHVAMSSDGPAGRAGTITAQGGEP